MAIKVEYVLTREDGVEIHRHFSDDHRYIKQIETGLIFESAEDPVPCIYTYEEGDQFEWYIEQQINETYTDEVIEAAISTKQDTATCSNNCEELKELEQIDYSESNYIS